MFTALADLNERQRAAVEHRGGPLLVVAGAGTGKTKTLAARVAYLLDEGVAGLVVSNHGGRVLDTVPASIEALPAIAQAVGGRVPLLLDGGVRRGTDIVKAIALGASAVLVGRPYMHGLAAAGALGVVHVLHILRTELEMAMVLCGCRTLDEIDASLLRAPAQRLV